MTDGKITFLIGCMQIAGAVNAFNTDGVLAKLLGLLFSILAFFFFLAAYIFRKHDTDNEKEDN